MNADIIFPLPSIYSWGAPLQLPPHQIHCYYLVVFLISRAKTLDPLKLLKFVLIFGVKICAGKQDVTNKQDVSLNFYVASFFTVQYSMLNTGSISQILLRLGILYIY